MVKKEDEIKEKIRIKIKAYDAKLVENSARQIIEAIKKQGGTVIGPIPLPTEIKRYTVNRSTFVHTKSKDQFEMRKHKRLIDVINPGSKIYESFKDMNIPSGVDIEIKTF
jgi:small subunit ribosomal protein S10